MDIDQCTHGGETEEPFRVGYAQVDASVAHRLAEVVVPVGAVQTVALVEIHREGNVRKIVARAGHVRGAQLGPYAELPGHGGMAGCARRDDERGPRLSPLIGGHTLLAHVNIDPATF